MASTNLDLTKEIKNLFSEKYLMEMVENFKRLPWQEEVLFDKYDDKSFKWYGQYENEHGDVSTSTKSLYYEFNGKLKKYTENLLITLSNVRTVFKDESKTLSGICKTIIDDLRVIRTSNYELIPFIIRYFNEIQISLVNLEGEVQKIFDEAPLVKAKTNSVNGLIQNLPYTHNNLTVAKKKLTKLYHALLEKGYIGTDTNLEDFLNVFSDKNQALNKINWTGGKFKQKDGSSSLVYFIKQLNERKLVSTFRKQVDWKLISEVFQLNGEPIRKDLRVQKTSDADKPILDAILSDLAYIDFKKI